jgi:capsular polysaccharide export protein
LSPRRTILFLQGPSSVFWRELAGAFAEKGHSVHKINLCFADQVYWRRPGAYNYRGRFKHWKQYLASFLQAHKVTDVIYYADRFPYHVVAAEIARDFGILSFVLENGYLRPDWITLEREGMSAYSHFPSDPSKISAIAKKLTDPDLTVRYEHSPAVESFNETFFHLNAYCAYVFPFYQSDKYYNPVVDLLSGFARQRRLKRLSREADKIVATLARSRSSFYLVALQTQGDYQVRDNSPYRHITEMVEAVISSFAREAPQECLLVFKIHPHDNGIENWSKIVAKIAAKKGIAERAVTIDGGNLSQLLVSARGVVVINSTVGLQAIRALCPVKVLGIAIYDIPGLTHQGSLETFWNEPERVDPQMALSFIRALAGATQVKGSFYHPEGRKAAIDEIVGRIEKGWVNQPDAFEPVAPRFKNAKELGVPVGPEPASG